MVSILVSGPEMGLPERERVAWGFQEALGRRLRARQRMTLKFAANRRSGYHVELYLPYPVDDLLALSRDCGRCLNLGLDLDSNEACQVSIMVQEIAS